MIIYKEVKEMRLSRIKELWNDEEFMKEAIETVERVINEYETPEERINAVYWAFGGDEEKGIIAVFLLGQYPVMALAQSK